MPGCCGAKTAVPCARRSASEKRRLVFKGQHHCQTGRQRRVEVSVYLSLCICVLRSLRGDKSISFWDGRTCVLIGDVWCVDCSDASVSNAFKCSSLICSEIEMLLVRLMFAVNFHLLELFWESMVRCDLSGNVISMLSGLCNQLWWPI